MAKIRYTISTNTPGNHAERPLFVTSAAVRVAMNIIATAPVAHEAEPPAAHATDAPVPRVEVS